jgi:LmbE family N-acetylglucosaminyl deacetylase
MNVLVVAAHPDDEVLGAGGTIAALARSGHAVHILILGEGATSRASGHADDVAALQAASVEASSILGAAGVRHGGLPDNRFDSVDLLDVVQLIESEIGLTEPDVVLSQHGGDVNVDHERTFRAVLAATRPVPGSRIRSVLSFEVASSTEWAFGSLAPAFTPNVFWDISDTLPTKLDALRAYALELRPFPHPRSEESVTAQAQRWGTGIGVAAAEAFRLVWERR